MRKNAAEALVFQDEMEIHRHPTLTRMWAPVGVQPEVPAPGQNEKQVVYGGVDYATGRIVHMIAASKSGVNFLAFLIASIAAYKGKKVRTASKRVAKEARNCCSRLTPLAREPRSRR